MTAAEFLQAQQERAYREMDRPPVNFRKLSARNWEALRSELLERQRPRSSLEEALDLEQSRAAFAELAAVSLPTPYENPVVHSMMTAAANDVEEAAARVFNTPGNG
jgi:hypothetical protein